MAMWAVQGIGLLINTIQGIAQKQQQTAQLAKMQAQTMAQAAKLKAGMDKGLNIKGGGIMGGPSTSLYVDFPDKAYNSFHDLQQNNLSERMGLESSMRGDLGKAKDGFFKDSHYKTEFGSQGSGKVVLGADGKPEVMRGAETDAQRAVREGFEAQNRKELANKHASQVDKFTQSEAEKCKNFLRDNISMLNDPGVHSELQKMIVAGKKKSLKLQQDQEEERWRIDMPPTDEIQGQVEMGMSQLRDMGERHLRSEETSPDQAEILQYNQEFARAAAEERGKIEEVKADSNFLLDPRKMMAMATKPEEKRFDQVLPGHLTESLFQMGVYSV